MIETAVAAGFFISMAAPLLFVLIYMLVPWWRTWEGRVIMAQKLLFCLFLLNGVLYYRVGPDYPFREAFRVFLYVVAMPVTLWSMTALLIVRQLQGRADQKLPPEMHPDPPLEPVAESPHYPG